MSYCLDYPACGHSPSDPCGSEGATADDYLTAWARRAAADPGFDPLDDYYEGGY